jgi:hypothetical protein
MTNQRKITLLLAILLICIAAQPVSAVAVGTICEKGAFIFIGEEGLNVTHALNQANGLDSTPAYNDSVPTLTQIGWWASAADISSTAPSKVIDLKTRYASFTVAPSDFVGYTGTWYLLGLDGKAANQDPLVFTVADPMLDIRIWDFDLDADVTGTTVTQGDKLGFRIDTNMYPAVDGRYRGPINPDTDGFINIKIKDESNAQLTELYNDNVPALDAGPNSVMNNFVDSQPFFWGKPDSSGGFNWDTGALNSYAQNVYPVGTYTVSAESALNNMKTNYQQGGADYTGKTVSAAYTVTLALNTVKLEANKDSLTRGQSFSVTITGMPNSLYYLWVKDTSGLTGGNDNQAPMIVLSQVGVTLDPASGPYPIGSYQYQDGGGQSIRMNVGTDPVYHGARYYGSIKTSAAGTRTIEFLTNSLTRTMMYTIRVENQSGLQFRSDEVGIVVEKGTRPVLGIGLYRPSTQMWYLDYNNNALSDYRIRWGDSTDIPVTGDWDGDNIDENGLYRPSTQMWYLDYDNNGMSNYRIKWGDINDIPVAGDWDGDNIDEIGLYRPSTQMWYLDYDNNGVSNYRVKWGESTDIPVIGDWHADNRDEIGLYRPSTQMWYLDYDNNGMSNYRIKWGDINDIPVAGDWDDDNMDEIGLYRPSTQMWYLDYDINGASDIRIKWGDIDDIPLTGAWS